MSLLQKASIITTPTAYAEDYLYSIKPAYALGENLDVLPSADSAVGNHYKFSPYGNNTVQYVNGETIITYVDNTSGAFHYFQTSYNLSQNLTVGRKYKVEISFKVNTGSFNWQYYTGTSTISLGTSTNTDFQTITYSYTAGHASNTWVRTQNFTSGQIVTVRKITIQEVTDADFDFDRNSTGTRVNEDYLIEDVPYNLLPQSNTFETTWQLVNATLNDGYYGVAKSYDSWLLTKSAANGRLNQFTSISSQTHTYSIYAKANDSNWMKLQVFDGSSFYFTTFNLSNGSIGTNSNLISSSIEGVRDGWYRCSIQFSAAITVAYIYPAEGDNDTSGASGSIYIQNAQIVKGDQPKDYLKTTDRLDIPRIDYTNGEPSILLEPSRTNLFPYSNDYTQSDWTKTNVTITQNAGISPENLNNASKMIASANASFNYIFDVLSGSSSQYTISAFVKADGRNIVWLYTSSVGTNGVIYFDLSDASMQVVAGSAGTPTGTITKMPNGWYRITSTSHTFTLSSGSGIGISDAKGSLATTTDGTNGVLIYGLQVEAGSYATSLIHTSGSAVTRSADAANNAGNSDLISSTEGVLYAELKTSFEDTSGVQAISLQDSSNNYISIYFRDNNNFTARISASGGATQIDSKYVTEQFYKVALSYNSSNTKLFIDGRQIGNTTTTALVSGLNELAFDRGSGFGTEYEGNAKMVAVFKEALTDLELEKLTGYNNHELYMNYYNRLSYLGLVEEYNVESDINNYIL